MQETLHGGDQETRLLAEIEGISRKVRGLRHVAARENAAEIKLLEAKARSKWEELRSLRAGPAAIDVTLPRSRGHYQ